VAHAPCTHTPAIRGRSLLLQCGVKRERGACTLHTHPCHQREVPHKAVAHRASDTASHTASFTRCHTILVEFRSVQLQRRGSTLKEAPARVVVAPRCSAPPRTVRRQEWATAGLAAHAGRPQSSAMLRPGARSQPSSRAKQQSQRRLLLCEAGAWLQSLPGGMTSDQGMPHPRTRSYSCVCAGVCARVIQLRAPTTIHPLLHVLPRACGCRCSEARGCAAPAHSPPQPRSRSCPASPHPAAASCGGGGSRLRGTGSA